MLLPFVGPVPPSHHHMDFEFCVAFFYICCKKQKEMKTSEIKQTEHSSRSAEPKCTHAHCCRMCKCMSDDRPITRRENDARAGRRRLALLSRGHDHDGASVHAARSQILRPAGRGRRRGARSSSVERSHGMFLLGHIHIDISRRINQCLLSMIDQSSTPAARSRPLS